MADDSENRSIHLSLRLLREGATVETALREDHELEEQESEFGRLFTGQAPALPPTWLGFVSTVATGALPRLVNQNCSAVLFLEVHQSRPVTTRIMALSFGSGHHSLNPDSFERSFGLRVVLNAVARSNLRSLDIATLDATTFQKRIQASRDADLRGFGIDVDRDLLRLAAGSPRDGSFARSLAGKDALTLHTKVAASSLKDKCLAALQLYLATDYRKDFAFIDYVTPVRHQDILSELDGIVFDELKALVQGRKSDLHIALPDTISPEESTEIGYFGIGLKSGQKQPFTQVAIDDYVAQLQGGKFDDIADMAALRASHEVRLIVNGQGDAKRKRKLYECFVFEVEHKGSIYVLFGGDWFVVEKAFHKRVEADFQKLGSKPNNFVAIRIGC